MSQAATPRVFIIVPAFNEATVIGQVVEEINTAGYANVIVVDDGSRDDTAAVATAAKAVVVRHRINRGKGAAAKTGLEAAKQFGADIMVTMDGDGQHDPHDITSLIAPIKRGECDVVLGTRPLQATSMPWHKVVSNHIANGITWTYSGLWVADSQSGFRAYSRAAAEQINTRADTYEYESEVIRAIAIRRLRFQEVPITVRYTAYSMAKQHRQGIVNGVKTVYKLMWNRLL